MQVHVKKLQPEAKLPTYAHAGDAGMDLYAATATTLLPGERAVVPTGIAVAIPAGYVGLIWDKSSVAATRGLKTLGGVIDAGYRGEIMVGLLNTSTEPQTFAAGDKVAQLLIQAVERPQLIVVAELDESARGDGGFGSTGRA